jgi:hypothetical protein
VKIVGLEGMSDEEIQAALKRGARFVLFEYTISVLVLTFKRPSNIHFIRPGEGTFGKSIGFTLLTLLLGWWGVPWGPIYSVAALVTNLGGGKDVTADVLASAGGA